MRTMYKDTLETMFAKQWTDIMTDKVWDVWELIGCADLDSDVMYQYIAEVTNESTDVEAISMAVYLFILDKVK